VEVSTSTASFNRVTMSWSACRLTGVASRPWENPWVTDYPHGRASRQPDETRTGKTRKPVSKPGGWVNPWVTDYYPRLHVADAHDTDETRTSETRKRAPLSPDVKKAVWVRDSGRCQRCGIGDSEAFRRDGEHLHFDHIIPFSLNGADTVNNIQLLCGPCNRAKAASLPG
jgi:HNH endonuclease